MDQAQTFLAMGGYGGFVWPAFVLTAAVLVGLLVTTLRRLRALEGDLLRLQASEPPAASGARIGGSRR
jgi:heme exporter protein D